jgi:hypothetical protein
MALAPLAPCERPVITVSIEPLGDLGNDWYTLTATVTTTAAATVAAISAAASSTTVPSHLGKARINVLLGLLENIDEVASLLSIYCDCMSASLLRWMKRDAREEKTYCQW